ncbi:unnamed protein product [Urochloa humidicola]
MTSPHWHIPSSPVKPRHAVNLMANSYYDDDVCLYLYAETVNEEGCCALRNAVSPFGRLFNRSAASSSERTPKLFLGDEEAEEKWARFLKT